MGDFVGEGDLALAGDLAGGVLGAADGLATAFFDLVGALEGLLAWISVWKPRLVCTMVPEYLPTGRFSSEKELV